MKASKIPNNKNNNSKQLHFSTTQSQPQQEPFKKAETNLLVQRNNERDKFTLKEEVSNFQQYKSSNTGVSGNLNIDLLNEYLMDDDLLEQIERQYLSKNNSKKNRSPISLTKTKPILSSQPYSFDVHSLLDHQQQQLHSGREQQQSIFKMMGEEHPEPIEPTTTSEIPNNNSTTMVIENIIKSLINSSGSNCHKIITERYIKDVVKINKSNQMWITNISKTDMSSCTMELQSISNTLAKKKIPPCEKVVRITVYSSLNGKPKKCIISTSHHPNFGFKTINDTWIFENSTNLLPDTFIIPEQNILRFLQLTFIGSHTFANTHRIKHISVTLEDAILSNKEYIDKVKMEINGIQGEEITTTENLSLNHNNNSSVTPESHLDESIDQPTSYSNSIIKQSLNRNQTVDEEDDNVDPFQNTDESNPLLKQLNSDTGNTQDLSDILDEPIIEEFQPFKHRVAEEQPIEEDNTTPLFSSTDTLDEEELEKELMQLEVKLNEKKKILDTINNSPIKSTQFSPVVSRRQPPLIYSPNKFLPDYKDSPVVLSPVNKSSPVVVETHEKRASNTMGTVLSTARTTRTPPPLVSSSFEKLQAKSTKSRHSPVKKVTFQQPEKPTTIHNPKPIVIDFTPSPSSFIGLPTKPNNSGCSIVTLNRKSSSSLISFLSQLQSFNNNAKKSVSHDEQPSIQYNRPTASSILKQQAHSPHSSKANAILEKLHMQKKLKEELDYLKQLNEKTSARQEYSPPHLYTSPTKNIPFLNDNSTSSGGDGGVVVVDEQLDSDASSDITLTVEEDEFPSSPPQSPIITRNESELLVSDYFQSRSQSLIPQRSAPSPPFRVINDLSPEESFEQSHYSQAEDEEETLSSNKFDEFSPKRDLDMVDESVVELDEKNNDDNKSSDIIDETILDELIAPIMIPDRQQPSPSEEIEEPIVDEELSSDQELLETLLLAVESEDDVIEQFNRASQNNSFNIEIPKEMEEELIEDASTIAAAIEQEQLVESSTPSKSMQLVQEYSSSTPSKSLHISLVQDDDDNHHDEDSIIQSFLDTTLSSDNSFIFTPSKSPTTTTTPIRISTPTSSGVSIPILLRPDIDSPRVSFSTPSKILLKGEPSRLLRIKNGINCYLHNYDPKKKKFKIHKRTLKLDSNSKYLSISNSGKSLFKKTTKLDLFKDVKWIVYGPYSTIFKNTNLIFRPFKCFSIVTHSKVYSFEVTSEGIRDVDDTILGLQFLIQERIKSFNRPVYTKCNLIAKRYLLKKYITFSNTSVSIDDDMSSITSDSITSPTRMMRSRSFKF